MKTKVKISEDQKYPIEVVIQLENREDAMRFLAASVYGANPDFSGNGGFYEEIMPFLTRSVANDVLNKMLPYTQWEQIFQEVRGQE